ncbi:MAG: hypothetical protein K0S56_2201 [Microvirga sp.]|nr:hypothetical protein [Microvirga sp.]
MLPFIRSLPHVRPEATEDHTAPNRTNPPFRGIPSTSIDTPAFPSGCVKARDETGEPSRESTRVVRSPSLRRYRASNCRRASEIGTPTGTGTKISRRASAALRMIGSRMPISFSMISRVTTVSVVSLTRASAISLAEPALGHAMRARAPVVLAVARTFASNWQGFMAFIR